MTTSRSRLLHLTRPDTLLCFQSLQTVRIYARWSGYTDPPPRNQHELLTATPIYAVHIPPSEPLAVGQHVSILALSPKIYRSSTVADIGHYDAYDAHITGRIARVEGLAPGGRAVLLEVVNECRINPVRRVLLEVPYVPGVMVWKECGVRMAVRPKEAREEDMDTSAEVGALPTVGRCRGRECAIRATALGGDGIVDVWRMNGYDAGRR